MWIMSACSMNCQSCGCAPSRVIRFDFADNETPPLPPVCGKDFAVPSPADGPFLAISLAFTLGHSRRPTRRDGLCGANAGRESMADLSRHTRRHDNLRGARGGRLDAREESRVAVVGTLSRAQSHLGVTADSPSRRAPPTALPADGVKHPPVYRRPRRSGSAEFSDSTRPWTRNSSRPRRGGRRARDRSRHRPSATDSSRSRRSSPDRTSRKTAVASVSRGFGIVTSRRGRQACSIA